MRIGRIPLSGYEVVKDQVVVPGSAEGSIQVSCPEGKVVTGAGSFWGQTSVAHGTNPISTDNLLVLTVYCVESD